MHAYKPLFLALLCLLPAAAYAAEASISVVIPAKKPSRAAHFNWHFTSANGAAVQTGQYACGSYWVAPAVGDNAVVLTALKGSPDWDDDLLSCDADPITERHGLLSGKNNYGSYDASENILSTLPHTLKAAKNSCISLVAAMQRNEEKTSKGGTRQIVGEVVDAYCMVTVLDAAPSGDSKNMLRPNITGSKKEFLTWNDFDLDRLPSYDFIKGNSDDTWKSVARTWGHSTEIFGLSAEIMTKRHGLKFRKFSEGGRAFRSHLLIHNYAAGTAQRFNSNVLSLFANDGDMSESKRQALAAMISYGLDMYHARYNYGDTKRKAWNSGAGQSLGTLIPPVLAAALLKDESKAHQLRKMAITNHHKDAGLRGPQELRQIKRGVTGVLLWGDGNPIVRNNNNMTQQDWRYWADFSSSKCYDAYPGKGNPHRGKKTAADPYGYIDGPANKPGSSYMSVSLGGFRATAAIMILMPSVRNVVNTDNPIEYVDRLTRHGLWTAPDPLAPPAKVDQETAKLWWSAKGVQEWGKTWGVKLDDVRFAIENGEGRFKSLHGKPFKGGYESGQARDNWDTIIAMYDGAKFEDHQVGLDQVVAPEILFETGDKPLAHIFCQTPDSLIVYTTDGSTPNRDSTPYVGKPIPVDSKTQIKAIAYLDGKKPSHIAVGTLPLPLAAAAHINPNNVTRTPIGQGNTEVYCSGSWCLANGRFRGCTQ